jgi:hypothetical protein
VSSACLDRLGGSPQWKNAPPSITTAWPVTLSARQNVSMLADVCRAGGAAKHRLRTRALGELLAR